MRISPPESAPGLGNISRAPNNTNFVHVNRWNKLSRGSSVADSVTSEYIGELTRTATAARAAYEQAQSQFEAERQKARQCRGEVAASTARAYACAYNALDDVSSKASYAGLRWDDIDKRYYLIEESSLF